jgi:hypothetical protein
LSGCVIRHNTSSAGNSIAEFGCHGHVIVVAVRAHHRHHMPPANGHHDRAGVMGEVEHDDLRIVPDDPDVLLSTP